MKIILITDLYLPNIGGVEMVVYNLAKQFTNRGHKVTVIAAKTPRNLASRDLIDGIEIYRLDFILPTLRIKSIFGFLTLGIIANIKLLWLLKRVKPEIVNAHFIYANGSYTLLSKKLLNYPLVVSVHGNDVQQFPYESKICKGVLKNLLNSADFITGCSRSLLNDANQIAPEIQNKSQPIPNGIDLQEFELKEKYLQARPYIFSIGRFVHKKGFDILIKAFKQVADKKLELDLIIAGTGEEWQICAHLVNELGLKERVKMLGFVERKEVIKLYNGCEFFVLPSRIEPFGITNLEAMAAGKAIIAADVDGVPEIIRNGENGILFKPENINELAEKIVWLFENNEIKENMERCGRLLVEKKYDWESIADRYIKIYETNVRIK
jgi:glycosyltransferase involved in cell wall biosynthesis